MQRKNITKLKILKDIFKVRGYETVYQGTYNKIPYFMGNF